MTEMKRQIPFLKTGLVLITCGFFLWMFLAAATLERTADLGRIVVPPGQNARTVAYDFAAKWRHGMAGNSPIYMPGFFATAIAIWFWCDSRSLRRMLFEGAVLIAMASCCAAVLAPLAAPRIIADFRVQQDLIVSNTSTSWTWITFALGVYTLLTWSTLIVALRWSIRLRSLKPLAFPLGFYIVLALVRHWTVAGLSSQWTGRAMVGEPAAVVSFLLIPILAGVFACVELRSRRRKSVRLTKTIESH